MTPSAEDPGFAALIRRVAARQRAVAVGARARRALIVLMIGFAVLLAAQRAFAAGPDWFEWWVPLVLPIAALVLACAPPPRADELAAARRVDEHAGAHDLFLTRSLLEPARGEFKAVVAAQAERRARGIDAADVVPLDGARPALLAGGAVAALCLLAAVVPALDLLGRGAEREAIESRRKALAAQREQVQERRTQLVQRAVSAEVSKPVETTLTELREALQRMRPGDAAVNRDQLAQRQRQLGEQWRRVKRSALQPGERSGRQSLGRRASERAREWQRELASGDSRGVEQELKELRDLAASLDRAPAEERDRRREEIADRLQELAQVAAGEPAAAALEQAIAQALRQLEGHALDELSGDASRGLDAALELTALELQQLAQAMRDLEALERALDAARLAQMLNDLDRLDGEACAACDSLGELSEAMRRMLAEQMAKLAACARCQGSGKDGEGQCSACSGTGREGGAEIAAMLRAAAGGGGAGAGAGVGTGGAGRGLGGLPGEDASAPSDFVAERSRAHLTAGRLLMQLKETAGAESGRVEREYREALDAVRQGVSRAVDAEDVPPAYRDAIRGYFDALGPPSPPKKK